MLFLSVIWVWAVVSYCTQVEERICTEYRSTHYLVYTQALLYCVISFIASFDFHMKLFYVLILCICIYPITNKGLDKGGIQFRCKFFRIILEFRILRLTFR